MARTVWARSGAVQQPPYTVWTRDGAIGAVSTPPPPPPWVITSRRIRLAEETADDDDEIWHRSARYSFPAPPTPPQHRRLIGLMTG